MGKSFKVVSLCFALMVWNCSSRGSCLERTSFISMLPGTVKGITHLFSWLLWTVRQIRREGVARTFVKARVKSCGIIGSELEMGLQSQICFHLFLLCAGGAFPQGNGVYVCMCVHVRVCVSMSLLFLFRFPRSSPQMTAESPWWRFQIVAPGFGMLTCQVSSLFNVWSRGYLLHIKG